MHRKLPQLQLLHQPPMPRNNIGYCKLKTVRLGGFLLLFFSCGLENVFGVHYMLKQQKENSLQGVKNGKSIRY